MMAVRDDEMAFVYKKGSAMTYGKDTITESMLRKQQHQKRI